MRHNNASKRRVLLRCNDDGEVRIQYFRIIPNPNRAFLYISIKYGSELGTD